MKCKNKYLIYWHKIKESLFLNTRKLYPKEREVWLVHLGSNIGSEQNGTGTEFERPVLVLKKLNNETFVVLPLTSQQKKGSFYYHLNEESTVILGQIRTLDVKRFIKNRKTSVSKDVFKDIIKKTSELLFGQLAADPEGKVQKYNK